MNSPLINWVMPSTENIKLEIGHAHLWLNNLSNKRFDQSVFYDILSTKEKNRANSFYNYKEKEKYILARAGLRNILSLYIKQKPSKIVFTYNSYGKPYLSKKSSPQNIFFNLSHSGDVVVYVFMRGSEIGVDVEKCIANINFLDIAKNLFPNMEYQWLLSLIKERQLGEFYKLWTIKESVTKALGQGIFYGFDRINTVLKEGECAPCEIEYFDKKRKESWWTYSFLVDSQHIGAFATKEKVRELKCWSYNLYIKNYGQNF